MCNCVKEILKDNVNYYSGIGKPKTVFIGNVEGRTNRTYSKIYYLDSKTGVEEACEIMGHTYCPFCGQKY